MYASLLRVLLNMHLDEGETDLLKKWVIKKLEDISDADSDVLADYVLALATTDEQESAAKKNCVDNLKDFLLDSTKPFVNELFQTISSKSFDRNKPPPKVSAPVYQPPKRTSIEQPRLPNESRKRSYHDWDREEGAGANGRIHPFDGGERPMKQPRRGRGRDQRGGRQSQSQMGQLGMPQLPTPPPGMPPIDPNNPMAALLAMQQAMGMFQGMPNAGSPTSASPFAVPRAGKRCRDYDTKGFCAAGASCPYEHGNDTLVVPQLDQEYDPNNAFLLNVMPSRVGYVDALQNDRGRGAGRGRGRGRGRGDSNFRGGGGRSSFSQVGHNRDRSITSIVVEQIPEDKCDEESVREFFAEFGEIEDVTLQQDKKLAIVKYDTNEAARAAYESPKVVFDNRFVKVYWYKPEKMSKPSQDSLRSPAARKKSHDVEMQEDEQSDPVEFARRQEEAQRKHDEAKKQREDATKQKQDLDAKLKAMEAERQKMAALLAKKTGKAASPTTEAPEQNGGEESEQTRALKAQLAKLEAEAKSLGIDPDAPTNGFDRSSPYRGRGGFRGRARGRGYYPNYRGGYAGPSEGRGGAVMRLDNRPKTVAVKFAEGSYDTHDEALRQFLLFNSLYSAALAKHPETQDTALITFSQRYEGENFMAAARNSELPHIGRVEMSWSKPEDKSAAANGDQSMGERLCLTEAPDQGVSDSREAESYDVAEEEDLDRWS